VVALELLPTADVVERLMAAHHDSRLVLRLAESLTSASATAATATTAARVSEHLASTLPCHFAEEEATLAPALRGLHPVVDDALDAIARDHFRITAVMARVGLLCRLISRDPCTLHTRRFELDAAVRDLRHHLEPHQELEESIIFPAIKRLLTAERVAELTLALCH
jgi:hypothetical protein